MKCQIFYSYETKINNPLLFPKSGPQNDLECRLFHFKSRNQYVSTVFELFKSLQNRILLTHPCAIVLVLYNTFEKRPNVFPIASVFLHITALNSRYITKMAEYRYFWKITMIDVLAFFLATWYCIHGPYSVSLPATNFYIYLASMVSCSLNITGQSYCLVNIESRTAVAPYKPPLPICTSFRAHYATTATNIVHPL